MTTEAIELICEKLGTTMENLIPATINYEKHLQVVLLIVGICITAFGILCAIAAKAVSKYDTYENDVDMILVGLIIIGIIAIIFGLLTTIIQAVDVYMWQQHPTIRAYETILKWIGG